jgi:hypothetical protein
MFKYTLTKRSLVAALAISAASFPTASQARLIEDPAAPVASQPSQVVNAPAVSQPSSSAQSGFRWGDAGIGAAGAIVLVGLGAGTAGAAHRRRAHRAVTG